MFLSTLAGVVSSIQTKEGVSLAVTFTEYAEGSDLTVANDDKAVFAHIHRASLFSHYNQRVVDYVFVLVIACLVASVITYRSFKPVIKLHYWFMQHRRKARSKVLSWKASNLLYKAKSLYY